MNTTTQTQQTITNRIKPCNCGCKGQDSQHAAHFVRTVSNIKHLDGVETRSTRAYGTSEVIATGEIKLNGNTVPVAFVVSDLRSFGEGCAAYGWRSFGWCRVID